MHTHSIEFSLASGRRQHGGPRLNVDVPEQLADRVQLAPGKSITIDVNGRVITLLAIASRNGVPDAEATLLAGKDPAADLALGPFPWCEFGHVRATSLDAGKPIQTVTIQNDNANEPCQIDYCIGFDPAPAESKNADKPEKTKKTTDTPA